MSHKTLIGGTAYSIGGGVSLVNGTKYGINKGRTLVGGSGYDIEFEPNEIVLVDENGYLQGTYSTTSGRITEGTTYTPNGSTQRYNVMEFYSSATTAARTDSIIFSAIDVTNYKHLYSYGCGVHTARTGAVIRLRVTGNTGWTLSLGVPSSQSYVSVSETWQMLDPVQLYSYDISSFSGEYDIQLYGKKDEFSSSSVYKAAFSNTWISKS